MAAFFSGDWWLKAVAGNGAYKKHVAKASAAQSSSNTADHSTSAVESTPATQILPPALALAQTPSVAPLAELSPVTSLPFSTSVLPETEHVVPLTEPELVTNQAPSALGISLQAAGNAISSPAGITPPSPASLHTQMPSHAPHFPHSSTPEELRQLEEYLQLSKQAQLEAFVCPEEFLVVSVDVYAGNMTQKHYEGSPWGMNLAFTNQELEGKCSFPKPFRPRPCKDVPRPTGYYDEVLRPGGEKRHTTARREKLRLQQAEKAMKVAQAKAEKAAKEVDKAVEETKKKAKTPQDIKGKRKAMHKVQWAEALESHWHYS